MRRILIVSGIAFPLLALTWLSSLSMPGSTALASVASDGTQGNQESLNAAIAISGNGRFVAFESQANNLVPFDFNNAPDLFVHDRILSITEMMPQGDDTYSQWMTLSYDGRYVAFLSRSSNLVPDDTNGVADIFMFDRLSSDLERVNLSSEGEQANDQSFVTAISPDGRYVSFYTYADNLLPGVNTNRHTLIRDRATNMTLPGSVSHDGRPVRSVGGKISPDARFVLFDSYEIDVVPNDLNDAEDVFIHDRWLGTTERVSVNSAGDQGNDNSWAADLSHDGRYVIFVSWSTNLVSFPTSGTELFWHDRITGNTQFASIALDGEDGVGQISQGAISANGRFITLSTIADNIVPNDTNGRPDVFIRDMFYGQTRLVSANLSDAVGNASSSVPDISDDGRVVAFSSSASDLVPVDTNGEKDIFTRELWFPTLAGNYADGAPGSFFALTGTRSLVTSTITMTVNGVPLGVVPVEPAGTFAFQLDTTQTDPGRYTIAVHAPFADEVAVIDLDPDAPLHPPEGSGPVFVVPAGIAERFLYLPAVYRPD